MKQTVFDQLGILLFLYSMDFPYSVQCAYDIPRVYKIFNKTPHDTEGVFAQPFGLGFFMSEVVRELFKICRYNTLGQHQFLDIFELLFWYEFGKAGLLDVECKLVYPYYIPDGDGYRVNPRAKMQILDLSVHNYIVVAKKSDPVLFEDIYLVDSEIKDRPNNHNFTRVEALGTAIWRVNVRWL